MDLSWTGSAASKSGRSNKHGGLGGATNELWIACLSAADRSMELDGTRWDSMGCREGGGSGSSIRRRKLRRFTL
jgi:hypothetical protein